VTGTTRALVDTSALTRLTRQPVADKLDEPLRDGRLCICSLVSLELLRGARSPAEYREISGYLEGLSQIPILPAHHVRALDVQRQLAERSHHRGVKLPDLLIAAAAEDHRICVIHYDADFDLIAQVTNQPVQWVVPRGSVP
jgi:predicted nucleic acid-binding protein